MPSDRGSLEALRNLIEETDLLLETTEPLPENRTPRCRELLRAALALVDDLAQADESPAAALGSKGGKSTAQKLTWRREIQDRARDGRERRKASRWARVAEGARWARVAEGAR